MTEDTSPYAFGQTDSIVEQFSKRTVNNSAAYLKGSLESHMKILDVGCGPGTITIDLARHVPLGHVTGIDTESASATLDKARAQAANEDVQNVEFRVADGLALPYADHTFDVVHAHQVLLHVNDPVGLLTEMRRVTKPGGIVACRTWDDGTMMVYPHSERILQTHGLYQRVMEEWGRNLKGGRYMHVWARKAGFKPSNIKVTSSNYTNYTPAERRYWADMMISVLKESPIRAAALEKGYATADDFEATKAAWEEWEANEDGLCVGVNEEVLCRV
ncbi:uncharacterized protein PHACADRAFT_31470 [Phanerochaete carnosa HHB-10118-sp]|uniref:Methyltransferase domain-containing protein n=1 Tax=Phanerochaete carnosa (strain HHB-10118-sp) TaxID=650164 RepID=K5VYF7_PHACS|nr:uncharacterized protein PHACADRAFT_31470 [Phanerochaete carnosa HHB-10118-sp]EKM51644.1 hypothetical protein PHACADRAFT_31470 [Phanerochaete carnosa HHB-10118-sp]